MKRVSADVVRDSRTGRSWYEVELAMDRPAAAEVAGDRVGDAPARRRLFGDLPLTPGMPVEAHIRTGERSVISYLVLAQKPIRVILINELGSGSDGEVCAVGTRSSVGRSLSLV